MRLLYVQREAAQPKQLISVGNKAKYFFPC